MATPWTSGHSARSTPFVRAPKFAAGLAEIRPLTERIDVFTLETIADYAV